MKRTVRAFVSVTILVTSSILGSQASKQGRELRRISPESSHRWGQVSELRAGQRNAEGEFVDTPGGSLIHKRAIDRSTGDLEMGRWADTVTFRVAAGSLSPSYSKS